MTLKDTAYPSHQELVWEDGLPLDSQTHGDMAYEDLVLPLRAWGKRTGFRAFVGTNSAVYYFTHKAECLSPDVFVVNGGANAGQHGWVVWEEGGLYPTLIVEILSPSTEGRDRGEKMRIYRDIFKTLDYILLDAETGGVEVYRLRDGVYERRHANRRGWFRLESLPLYFAMVDGRPRWVERNGNLLPQYSEVMVAMYRQAEEIDRERAAADRERAAADRERAAAERERAAADIERAAAAEARTRAEAAEAETARLRDELRRIKGE